MTNPALRAFIIGIENGLVFGQVLFVRQAHGIELRHVADMEASPEELSLLEEKDIRGLAQFTDTGVFRPLKSAPNLKRGWRYICLTESILEDALGKLYPGALADWYSALTRDLDITSYREFTERQTGMYRITATLDDTTAGAMMRACCHAEFCLKRRLWTVEGTPTDPAAGKSMIPCFEPCAILLEFARKMARLEQEGGATAVAAPFDPAKSEVEFDDPSNPRRIRFVLEKQATGPISSDV